MSKHKAKTDLREIEDIREDLDSLKTNTVALTHHLTEIGSDRVGEIKDAAETKAKELSKVAVKKYAKIEAGVKKNPTQALMLAFGAGLLASFMLNGRRH